MEYRVKATVEFEWSVYTDSLEEIEEEMDNVRHNLPGGVKTFTYTVEVIS